MKLYAISDLHLRFEANYRALQALSPHPEDWLILAGDIGEREEHLRAALSLLGRRFRRLLWTPGNHELWTLPSERGGLRGEAKYRRLVSICREFGALTPEDPYPLWPEARPRCRLAPLFLLYDYSFRPPEVPEERAVDWAIESDVLCVDEALLHPDPYPSRPAWCAARCRYTEERLQEVGSALPLVLINHYPLREDLMHLSQYPRFSIWCGTRVTENWHTRFPVAAVVYGHLHQRGVQLRDGVRFQEVSLGYPRDWDPARGIESYLQEVLPGE